MTPTVIEYVLSRLKRLGISDIFGVAGDYSFPINDAVCADPELRWVGNCNELNAAYAADGYARIKGLSAVSTTFGVGELSAINAIAGSYAEKLPIFHLVGMPTSQLLASKRISHHTLGDGNFDVFYQINQNVVCAHAILSPENCIEETERLISSALHHRQPVYLGFPADYAVAPIITHRKNTNKRSIHTENKVSDPFVLLEATEEIIHKLTQSSQSCVLAGSLAGRFGQIDKLQALIQQTGLPYATMIMDKSVLDETNSQYMGIYCGKLLNSKLTQFIENSQCILNVGAVLSDVNTAFFTTCLPDNKTIHILNDRVVVNGVTYQNVYMHDLLDKLLSKLPYLGEAANTPKKAQFLDAPPVETSGKIVASYLYPCLEKIFRPEDIIFSDVGNFSFGLALAHLPAKASFHSQSLWGSIGWATPAAFGAALAAPNKRVILATGEGAHQLTAQEISQFYRFGLKPIIFVLNNNGYLIERLFCQFPEHYYNDIPQWNYTQLPSAVGCDGWYCKKVTSCDELNNVLNEINELNCAAYIEIVTDKYDTAPLMKKMAEFVSSLYT